MREPGSNAEAKSRELRASQSTRTSPPPENLNPNNALSSGFLGLVGCSVATVLTNARFLIQNPPISICSGGGPVRVDCDASYYSSRQTTV